MARSDHPSPMQWGVIVWCVTVGVMALLSIIPGVYDSVSGWWLWVTPWIMAGTACALAYYLDDDK